MKISNSIYLSLAALLGFAACDKEAELQDPETGNLVNIEFSASMDAADNDSPLSKTMLSAGWDFANGNTDVCGVKFTGNEAISVFGSNGEGVRFANKTPGDNFNVPTAIFAGDIQESSGYFALYPYNKPATLSGNVISTVLPDIQSPVQWNSFDEAAAVSVAYTSNSDRNFRFKNATAMLVFWTTDDLKSFSMETLDGTPLAGKFSVSVPKDGSALAVSGGTSNKVTLMGNINTNQAYFLNVLPAKIKAGNLKLTYTHKDGKVVSRIVDKPVEFKTGVCTRLRQIYTGYAYVFQNQDGEPVYRPYPYNSFGDVWLCWAPSLDLCGLPLQRFAYFEDANGNKCYPGDNFEVNQNMQGDIIFRPVYADRDRMINFHDASGNLLTSFPVNTKYPNPADYGIPTLNLRGWIDSDDNVLSDRFISNMGDDIDVYPYYKEPVVIQDLTIELNSAASYVWQNDDVFVFRFQHDSKPGANIYTDDLLILSDINNNPYSLLSIFSLGYHGQGGLFDCDNSNFSYTDYDDYYMPDCELLQISKDVMVEARVCKHSATGTTSVSISWSDGNKMFESSYEILTPGDLFVRWTRSE